MKQQRIPALLSAAVLCLLVAALPCAAQGEAAPKAPEGPKPWAFTAPVAPDAIEDTTRAQTPLEAFGFARPVAANVEQRVKRAADLSRAGKWNEAAAELTEARRLAPNDAAIDIQLGQALSLAGRYNEARAVWTALVERNPRSAWLRARLGGIELRDGNDAAAEEHLAHALKLDPTELSARFHTVSLRLKQKDAEGARRAMGSLNLLEVGTLATWIADEIEGLSTLFGEEGLDEMCELLLTGGETPTAGTSAEKQKRDAASWHALMRELSGALWKGFDSMRNGEWADADAALTESIRMGMRAPAVLNDVAFCRAQLGDTQKAESIMRQLAKFYPESPLVLTKYGAFCLMQSNYAAAADALARAREMAPYQVDTALHLAGAHAATGALDKAWEVLGSIPPETRPSTESWFHQDRPYAAALREDSRRADWLKGR